MWKCKEDKNYGKNIVKNLKKKDLRMIRLKKWYNKKETALQKGSDEYHIYLEMTKGLNISEKGLIFLQERK